MSCAPAARAGIRRRAAFAFYLASVFALVLALPAQATWLPGGSPIADSLYYLRQWPFTLASDGEGGAYFGWGDGVVLGSHVLRDGSQPPGWPVEGLILYDLAHYSDAPLTVIHGEGGAYVVFDWLDCTAHCAFEPTQLRVQHVLANGSTPPAWGRNGVEIDGSWGTFPRQSPDYGNTVAVPDAHGGVIVVWAELGGGAVSSRVTLRAQRIDSTGTQLWTLGGVCVRTATTRTFLQAVAPSEDGGATIAWLDERSPGLFAQRLDPLGAPRWATDGVPLARTALARGSRPVAVSDGARGAIVTVVATTARDSGVFATRVDAAGRLPWRDAVRIGQGGVLDSLRAVPARGGGAIVAWRDRRTSGAQAVMTQHVDARGRPRWGRDGAPVCAAPGERDAVALAPDDAGGAYVAWADSRAEGEVFATHLEPSGRPAHGWTTDGLSVCPRFAAVQDVRMIADGEGGAIVAWTDARGGVADFEYTFWKTWARKLEPHGLAPAGGHRRPRREPQGAIAASAPAHAADPAFALHRLAPNPGVRGAVLRFALADASPATLALFDVAGRRIWSYDAGALGAGEHAVPIAEGAWLPPGLYLARLSQGTRTATARVVITR